MSDEKMSYNEEARRAYAEAVRANPGLPIAGVVKVGEHWEIVQEPEPGTVTDVLRERTLNEGEKKITVVDGITTLHSDRRLTAVEMREQGLAPADPTRGNWLRVIDGGGDDDDDGLPSLRSPR
jgi:hypothetical protein